MAVVSIHYRSNKGQSGELVEEVNETEICDVSEAVVKLVVRHLYPETSSRYPYPEAVQDLPQGDSPSDKLNRAIQVAETLGFTQLSFRYLESKSAREAKERYALL
ncbi:hypothetical protein [Gallaecimonas sp. GXIMD4217]|uniref:hypothetical protein n=1 Tax=Gallaecimonas sp. GXIMD4217 TaxID=3131927 RepID=UPI00311B1F47